MAQVELYTTGWCPYCARARALLESKGVAFTDIDLDEEPRRRDEMIRRAGGRPRCRRSSSMANISAAATTSSRSTAPASSTQAGDRRMTHRFTAACIQYTAGPDPEPNLRHVAGLVRQARDAGRRFRHHPRGRATSSKAASAGATRRGMRPTTRSLPACANWRANSASAAAGLAGDRSGRRAGAEPGEARLANRSFLIDAAGGIVARYDKIHMFDIDLPGGESYRESNAYRPGGQTVVAETPWGRLGMSVCYDVRFPHLYRALAQAGADFLSVPSGIHGADRHGRIGMCCCAHGRSRTAASSSRRRNGASMPAGARAMAIR